jgi:hypothetical protein
MDKNREPVTVAKILIKRYLNVHVGSYTGL